MGKNYNNYYKKHNTDGPVKEPEEKKEETINEVADKIEDREPVAEVKEETPATAKAERAIVNTDRLNFRAKPSKDAEIFSILKRGGEVNLLSETTDVAGWSYISVDGKLGYVMTEFIDIKR